MEKVAGIAVFAIAVLRTQEAIGWERTLTSRAIVYRSVCGMAVRQHTGSPWPQEVEGRCGQEEGRKD